VNVELHIEELVLHGFPPDHRIGEAIEHELSRLFTERGVPPSLARSGDIPSLDAGAFQINPELGAEAVGAQVARSLYGGLYPQRNAIGEKGASESRNKAPVASKSTGNGAHDQRRVT
jgi:hypothetical protein